MKRGLIIFIKNPILGTAKTRLAKTIGDEKALEVYKQLLVHTRNVASLAQCDRFLYYNQFIDPEDEWSNDTFIKGLQVAGDLGEKMGAAFREQFENGMDELLIIGSDCGTLKVEHIQNAFSALENNKVVFGPSEDGGYYLLGMKGFVPELFESMPWSQQSLLQVSEERLKGLGHSWAKLELLNDIDTYEDWCQWKGLEI